MSNLKKQKPKFIESTVLIIIILFTVISSEWINFVAFENNFSILKSAHNHLACFIANRKNVNIKTKITKIDFLTYQIVLTFDQPMKSSTSFYFLPPCDLEVANLSWNNSSSFSMVVKIRKKQDKLSLSINPKEYKGDFFATKCNKKLQSQIIQIISPK